jgi:Ala-tRNA(Pro) deacylase
VTPYERLIGFLEQHRVPYRLIDHAPEGRTDVVSEMRGHDIRHAAKCLILIAKQGKKITRYVLAVVPGDARVDFDAVKSSMDATYVSFASPKMAEALSGAPSGAVLPFAFDPLLEVVVDPSLLESDEIYFNAARLDRSMALKARHYIALAKPRLAPIALRASSPRE